MQVTVAVTGGSSTGEEDILFIEVEDTATVEDLKRRIEFQSNHPSTSQILIYNGQELANDKQTLGQYQVTPDSMLGMMLRKPGRVNAGSNTSQTAGSSRNLAAPAQRSQGTPPNLDPEMVRLQALGNPGALAQLRQFDDELADAVQDSARFRQAWEKAMRNRQDLDRARAERQQELARLSTADDFDIEAQARIEELIREEQIENERLNAHEFYPESFGTVHMLYIPVEVNGHTLKAFVDSGAQRTVMSPSCAEKCGVMRLLDKRYSGTAVGVGTAKILGRVHSAQIKIGSLYLPCSFMVVEGKSIDLLLGLDMLKRYQANIDLTKGALVIQGAEVQFLGEADIPKEVQEQEQALLDQAKKAGLATSKSDQASTELTQRGTSVPSSSNPSGPAQPAQQAATASTPRSPFPAEDISKLTDLGASPEEAVHLLEIAGGNVEAAAGLLLG